MWLWWMRQNFIAQFLQLLKLCDVQSDIVVEKNRALSVHQCQVQSLQFLVHPTDLLSTLLRCNCFSGIQKAVVDQSGSRPPKSNHNLFWYKFGFGKCFGASSWSNHWAGLLLVVIHNPLFIKCHNLIKKWLVDALQLLHKRRRYFKLMIIFDFCSAHEASTYRAFSPYKLASNAEEP